jgi:endonuclease/exonuclease/phosphatase family metal-dependent hydrolase
MKVVSWNIHRCFGTDRLYLPERIAEALREIDADLVALQEVDSSLRVTLPEGDEPDQLSFIARQLGMSAIMGPTLTHDYGAYGNAILSREPLVGISEEIDLSYRKVEPRGALVATFTEPFGKLRVVNTHLGLKYWERAFQIDRLLSEIVWRKNQVTLLLGDFNEWISFSGNNLRLERAFPNQAPRLKTFPSPWPRFALDRIFLSAPDCEVQILEYEVPRTSLTRVASDHLPIVLRFKIKNDESLT